MNLITNLNQAFEVKEKIDYIKKNYTSEDDIFFGLLPDTLAGRDEADRIIDEFLQKAASGWKVGDTVGENEIELIGRRIDQIQDLYMPDFLQQLKAPDVWETIEQMELRTGKKCRGSLKHYITVCVCRRYRIH